MNIFISILDLKLKIHNINNNNNSNNGDDDDDDDNNETFIKTLFSKGPKVLILE